MGLGGIQQISATDDLEKDTTGRYEIPEGGNQFQDTVTGSGSFDQWLVSDRGQHARLAGKQDPGVGAFG